MTISKLKKKLDKIFSEYIRLRDCLDITGTLEKGKCFTCGLLFPYKKLQCGHFISRGNNATRYDEQNCRAQCVRCNIFLKGNYIEFTLKLIDNYGRRRVTTLKKRGDKIKQFTVQELEHLISKYEKKVELLRNSYD